MANSGNCFIKLNVDFTTDSGWLRRVQQHNKGFVTSTKKRVPFELVCWEGCLNQNDAAHREKYLKSAWGKRYIKRRLQQYLTE